MTAPRQVRAQGGSPIEAAQSKPLKSPPIPPAFQSLVALYILLTGSMPTIVQALAFGIAGGAGYEFAVAMVTAVALDLVLIAAVVVLAGHPLGILHPLLIPIIVWPLVFGMAGVIGNFGGWSGVLVGEPVHSPYFYGLGTYSATGVWLAIAKYNGLQILALISTYFGFAFLGGTRSFVRPAPPLTNTAWLRVVLIALIVVSTLLLLVFVQMRGGIIAHVTSLGMGRFRTLAGAGPIMVATDLGAIALYVWIAARPADLKSPLFLACVPIVIAAQFISNGSRGSTIKVVLTLGLIWALRRKKIPWKTAALMVPLLFVAIGLLYAVRSSGWTQSTADKAVSNTSWTQSMAIAKQEVEYRRAISAPVPIIEKGQQLTGGPLLGSTYIAGLLAFVPRGIWTSKPRGSDSLYMQHFFGTAEAGTAVPVSATAEEYWNFGVVGVVLFSAIFGALIRRAYYFYWRRYPDPFAVIFYVLFLTSFRFDTRELVTFEQQAGLLFICYVVSAFVVPKSTHTGEQLSGRVTRRLGAIQGPPGSAETLNLRTP